MLTSVLGTRDECHPGNRNFQAFQRDAVFSGMDLSNTVTSSVLPKREKPEEKGVMGDFEAM